MLALLIVGAPNTLIIGVVAAVIGMSVGILWVSHRDILEVVWMM